MIKTVLFDLDGTFADTAPDLANALNTVLTNHNKPELDFSEIRPVVSHGGRALIELGFTITPDHRDFEPLRKELLSIYADNIALHTRIFDGIPELLSALDKQRICWGIVTNKPGWLTNPLLKALGVYQQAGCIVSGDTLPQRKPDPAPLIYACQKTGSKVEECVYIGDAERDIVAGRQAGMHTLAALYGYIGEHDYPEKWGSDATIDTPSDILGWLNKHN